MNRLTKCIIVVISAVAVVLAGAVGLMYSYHYSIMSMDLDMSSWNLSNSDYYIEPEVDGNKIEFYVLNKNGETVYVSDSWRTMDFKSINLCDNNDIVIITGDMGEQVLYYKNGTWSLNQNETNVNNLSSQETTELLDPSGSYKHVLCKI